jgi:hypothetical protein
MAGRADDDPRIKVTVFMPASLHLRLRLQASSGNTTISRLCREALQRGLDGTGDGLPSTAAGQVQP